MPIQNYQNPFSQRDEELAALYGEARQNSEDDSLFYGGLKSGLYSLGSGVNSTLAALARSTGLDSVAANRERAADEYNAQAAGFSYKTPAFTDVDSIPGALDWAAGALSSNIPLLGGMAGSAALGGIGGARLLGKERLVSAAGRNAVNQRIEALIAQGIQKEAAQEATKDVALAARKAADKRSALSLAIEQGLSDGNLGAKVGRYGGAFLPYATTTIGGTYDAIRNDPNATGTREEQARAAILSGLGQSIVGTTLEPLGVAHKILQAGKAAQLAKRVGMPARGLSPLQTFGLAAGGEGITEGLENVIQQKTQQAYNPNLDFDYGQLAENALGGVVVGGVMHAPTTAYASLKGSKEPEYSSAELGAKIANLEANTSDKDKERPEYKSLKEKLETERKRAHKAESDNILITYKNIRKSLEDLEPTEENLPHFVLLSKARAIMEQDHADTITPEVIARGAAPDIQTPVPKKKGGVEQPIPKPIEKDIAAGTGVPDAPVPPSIDPTGTMNETLNQMRQPEDKILPRVNVGAERSDTNVTSQAHRDFADENGLTKDMHDLFIQGKTDEEVLSALGNKLDSMPEEFQHNFVSSVRKTLGNPTKVEEAPFEDSPVNPNQPRANSVFAGPEDSPEMTEAQLREYQQGLAAQAITDEDLGPHSGDDDLPPADLGFDSLLGEEDKAKTIAPVGDVFAALKESGGVVPQNSDPSVAVIMSEDANKHPEVAGRLYGTTSTGHRFLNWHAVQNTNTQGKLTKYLAENHSEALRLLDVKPENLARAVLGDDANEYSKKLAQFVKNKAQRDRIIGIDSAAQRTGMEATRLAEKDAASFMDSLSKEARVSLGLESPELGFGLKNMEVKIAFDPSGRFVGTEAGEKSYAALTDTKMKDTLEFPSDVLTGLLQKQPFLFNGNPIPRGRITQVFIEALKAGERVDPRKLMAAARFSAEQRTVQKTRLVSAAEAWYDEDGQEHIDVTPPAWATVSTRPTPIQKEYGVTSAKVLARGSAYGVAFRNAVQHMLERPDSEGGPLVLAGSMDNNLYFATPEDTLRLYEDLGITEDLPEDVKLLERVGVILKKQSGAKFRLNLSKFFDHAQEAIAEARQETTGKDVEKVAREKVKDWFHSDDTHDGLMVRDENARLCQAVSIHQTTDPKTGKTIIEVDKGMMRSLLQDIDFAVNNGKLELGAITNKEHPSLNTSLQFKRTRDPFRVRPKSILEVLRMFPPPKQRGGRANLQQVMFSVASPVALLQQDRAERFTNADPSEHLSGDNKAKNDTGVHAGFLVDATDLQKKHTEIAAMTTRAYTLSSELVAEGSVKLLPNSYKEINEYYSKLHGEDLKVGDKVLIHRDPALSDGSSMKEYTFAGIMTLSANDVYAGIVVNPKDVLWKLAAGDFDGDSGVLTLPTDTMRPIAQRFESEDINYVQKGASALAPSRHGKDLLKDRQILRDGNHNAAQRREIIKADHLSLEAAAEATGFGQAVGEIMGLAQTISEFGLDNMIVEAPVPGTFDPSTEMFDTRPVTVNYLLGKVAQASISSKKKAVWDMEALYALEIVRKAISRHVPRDRHPVTGEVRQAKDQNTGSLRFNRYGPVDKKERSFASEFRNVFNAPTTTRETHTERGRPILTKEQSQLLVLSHATRVMQQLMMHFSDLHMTEKYKAEYSSVVAAVKKELAKFRVEIPPGTNLPGAMTLWNRLSDIDEWDVKPIPIPPQELVDYISKLLVENPGYNQEGMHGGLMRRPLYTELALRALEVNKLMERTGVLNEKKSLPSIFNHGANVLASQGDNAGAGIVIKATKEYRAIAKQLSTIDKNADEERFNSIQRELSDVRNHLELGYLTGQISAPSLLLHGSPSLVANILPASAFRSFVRTAMEDTSKPVSMVVIGGSPEGKQIPPKDIPEGFYQYDPDTKVFHHIQGLDVATGELMVSGFRVRRSPGPNIASEDALNKLDLPNLIHERGGKGLVYISKPVGWTPKDKSLAVNMEFRIPDSSLLDDLFAKMAADPSTAAEGLKITPEAWRENPTKTGPKQLFQIDGVKFSKEYERVSALKPGETMPGPMVRFKNTGSSDLDPKVANLQPGDIFGVTNPSNRGDKVIKVKVIKLEEGQLTVTDPYSKKRVVKPTWHIHVQRFDDAAPEESVETPEAAPAPPVPSTLTAEENEALHHIDDTVNFTEMQRIADIVDAFLGAKKGTTKIIGIHEVNGLLKGLSDEVRRTYLRKYLAGSKGEIGGLRGGLWDRGEDENRVYYIFVAGGARTAEEQLGALLHEIGHRVTVDEWDKLRADNPELADKIYNKFKEWKGRTDNEENKTEDGLFWEWLADQAGAFLAKDPEVNDEMGSWFKALADKLVALLKVVSNSLLSRSKNVVPEEIEDVEAWIRGLFKNLPEKKTAAERRDSMREAKAKEQPTDNQESGTREPFVTTSGELRYLSEDQSKALNAALSLRDATKGPQSLRIIGPAGTGKSTLVRELMRRWRYIYGEGLVQLASPTRRANWVMRLMSAYRVKRWSGERTSVENPLTLEQLMGATYDGEKGKFHYPAVADALGKKKPPEISYYRPGQVVIVDEISMMDAEELKRLKEWQKARGFSILLLGDNQQLPPVGMAEAPAFKEEIPEVALTQVMRQKGGNPLLDYLTNLRNGISKRLETNFNAQTGEGIITVSKQETAVAAIARLFNSDIAAANMNQLRIIAPRNSTGRKWNQLLHKTNYPDVKTQVAAGEVVIGYRNAEGALSNGVEYLVDDVGPERTYRVGDYSFRGNDITLKADDDVIRVFLVTPEEDANYGSMVIEHQKDLNRVRNIAIRTGQWKSFYALRDHYEALHSQVVSMSDIAHNGTAINAENEKEALLRRMFDLAYACTVHKAQGATVNIAVIDMDDLRSFPGEDSFKQKLLYTALSRASKTVIVVNSNAETSTKELKQLVDIGTKPEFYEVTPANLPVEDGDLYGEGKVPFPENTPRANTTPGTPSPAPQDPDRAALASLSVNLKIKEMQNAMDSIGHLMGHGNAPTLLGPEAMYDRLVASGNQAMADKILAYAKDRKAKGSARGVSFTDSDGRHYIYVAGGKNDTAKLQVGVLAHEIGHWLIDKEWNKLKDSKSEIAVAIIDDYHRKQNKTQVPLDKFVADGAFHEWLADNIASWILTNKEVKKATDNWFKQRARDFVKTFKQMWTVLRNLFTPAQLATPGFAPDIMPDSMKSVQAWMNSLAKDEEQIINAYGAAPKGESIADRIAKRKARLNAWAAMPDDFKLVNEIVPFISQNLDSVLNARDVALLRRIATEPNMRQRMFQLLGKDSNAAKAVAASSDNAAAYMYVLASAGILKPAGQVRGVLDALKQAVGMFNRQTLDALPDEVDEVLRGLNLKSTYVPDEQDLIDPKSPAARLYKERKDRYAKGVTGTAQKAGQTYKQIFGWMIDAPYERVVRLQNPTLKDLVSKLHIAAYELGGLAPAGMVTRMRVQYQIYAQRFAEIVKDMSEADKANLTDILFQKPGVSAKNAVVTKAHEQIKELMKELFKYEKGTGMDIKERKNYWPLVPNYEYFLENRDVVLDIYSDRAFMGPDGWPRVLSDYLKWIEKELAINGEAYEMGPTGKVESAMLKAAKKELQDMWDADPKKFIDFYLSNDAERALPGTALKRLGYNKIHTPSMRFSNPRELDFLLKSGNANLHNQVMSTLNTDIGHIANKYIKAASRRAEHQYFLRGLGDGGIKAVFDKARAEGASVKDIELVTNYMTAIQGLLGLKERDWIDAQIDKLGPDSWAQRYHSNKGGVMNDKLNAYNSFILTWTNISHLTLALASASVDPLGQLARHGAMKIFMQSIRDTREMMRNQAKKMSRSELEQFVDLAGTLERMMSRADIEDTYAVSYMVPWASRLMSTFFKWNGVEFVTETSRAMASFAAFHAIAAWAKQVDEGGEAEMTARKRLAELGLMPEDVVFSKPNKEGNVKILNFDERTAADDVEKERDLRVRAAIHTFVDQCTVRPDPTTRALWMSCPMYAIPGQWKSFVVTFNNNILMPAWARLAEEGNATPILLMGLTMIPWMLMADMIRDAVKMAFSDDDDDEGNKEWRPAWKRGWSLEDHVLYATQRSGFMGNSELVASLLEPLSKGDIPKALAEAGGVAASDALKINRWGASQIPLPGKDFWGEYDFSKDIEEPVRA